MRFSNFTEPAVLKLKKLKNHFSFRSVDESSRGEKWFLSTCFRLYFIGPFPRYETIGCFQDHSSRAIPTLEGQDSILDGSYTARQDAIQKCYQAAKKRGFHVFALQAGGWCAASATAPNTFDKYGKSTACQSDGEGGGWANQVYYISGTQSVNSLFSLEKLFSRCSSPSKSTSGSNAFRVIICK